MEEPLRKKRRYPTRHKETRGRKKKWRGNGPPRPRYKLTEEDAKEIWKLLQEGILSQTEIAEKFNIGQEAVSHINTGTRWNNVTGLPKRFKGSLEPPPSGAIVGRGREFKKRYGPLSSKHSALLVSMCLRSIVEGKDRVSIRVKKEFKYPVGFPAKYIVNSEEMYYVISVNTKKLMGWLYREGYSIHSYKDVVDMLHSISGMEWWLTEKFGMDILERIV